MSFAYGCPHLFAGKQTQRPHYCSYIQLEQLLASFPSFLTTTDDRLLYSFCASSVLWLRLLLADLKALDRAARDDSASRNAAHNGKRLRRGLAVGNVLAMQGRIINTCLVDRRASLSFSLEAQGPAIPLLLETSVALRAVRAAPSTSRYFPAAESEVLSGIQVLLEDRYKEYMRQTCTLLQTVAAPGIARPLRKVHELIDHHALMHAADITLRRHHPQALNENSSTHDELSFITAHQTFELWFPSVLSCVDDVIAQMLRGAPDLAAAEAGVRRVVAFYQLFGDMIRMPQTMSSADYLAFRSQLEGGSGLESIGFRALEITIGQRDPILIRNLTRMQLLTDELATRLSRPSLSDAYLHLLLQAGIIRDTVDLEQAAGRIAQHLRPTAAPNPHAALIALGEALVELEQELENWRHHHLSMVDRMIGYRKSLGVAGEDPLPLNAGTGPAPDGKLDGRPYLLQTFAYRRIFSYLWEARSRAREENMRPWLGVLDSPSLSALSRDAGISSHEARGNATTAEDLKAPAPVEAAHAAPR